YWTHPTAASCDAEDASRFNGSVALICRSPRRRDTGMGIVETIAITMGLGWASGFNLYAAMLTLGVLGATEMMVLPEGLVILQHPAVIAAAGFMYFIEFFADKTPGVDTRSEEHTSELQSREK